MVKANLIIGKIGFVDISALQLLQFACFSSFLDPHSSTNTPNLHFMSDATNGRNTSQYLHLIQGEEFQIKVENAVDIPSSHFADSYLQAFRAVKETIVKTIRYNEEKDKSEAKNSRFNNWEVLSEFNNVLAFSGERGSGKTSAMVTVRNVLVDQSWTPPKLKAAWPVLDDEMEMIHNATFIDLDLIDPSRFENRDTILGNIVGELYEKFRGQLRKAPHINVSQKTTLVKAFSKVFKSIQAVAAEEKVLLGDDFDLDNSLEALDRLAAGTMLRKRLIGLVQEYLKFSLPNGNSKEAYLVIPIDDLDMNITHAFKIIEEIRKYLLIPNVIVLMALKVDQMKEAVEQQYLNNFKGLRAGMKKPDNNEIERMANLYLEKVLPVGRLIDLPLVSAIDIAKDDNYKLVYVEKKSGDEEKSRDEEKPSARKDEEFFSIEQTVLQLIFDKTGLVFVAKPDAVHEIVPRTLRELQNFLNFLSRFTDFQKSDLDQKHGNLDQFKNYLVNQWASKNLDKKYQDLVGQFAFDVPNSGKNDFLVQELVEILLPEIEENRAIEYRVEEKNDHEGNKKRKDQVRSFRTTVRELSIAKFESLFPGFMDLIRIPKWSYPMIIGEALHLFSMIESWRFGKPLKHLAFALKAIYSIALQKAILKDQVSNGNSAWELTKGGFHHPKSEILPTLLTSSGPISREYITFSKSFQDSSFSIEESAEENTPTKEVFIEELKEKLLSETSEQKDASLKLLNALEWSFSFIFPGKEVFEFYEDNQKNRRKSSGEPIFWALDKEITGSNSVSSFVLDFLAPFFNFLDPFHPLTKIVGKEDLDKFKQYSIFNSDNRAASKSTNWSQFYSLEVLLFLFQNSRKVFNRKAKSGGFNTIDKTLKLFYGDIVPELLDEIHLSISRQENSSAQNEPLDNRATLKSAFYSHPVFSAFSKNDEQHNYLDLLASFVAPNNPEHLDPPFVSKRNSPPQYTTRMSRGERRILAKTRDYFKRKQGSVGAQDQVFHFAHRLYWDFKTFMNPQMQKNLKNALDDAELNRKNMTTRQHLADEGLKVASSLLSPSK